MKIGHPKNFWGGVAFAAIGAAFALIARGLKLGDTVLIPGYAMGVPARMGPAFFPFWLGAILFVIGVAIMVIGVKGTKGQDGRLERFHWHPVLFVLIPIVLFGVLLKVIGMLAAGLMLIIVSGYASEEFKLRDTLVLAFFLVLFSAAVFVWGLKLPIPLCPDIEALQTVKFCRG